MTKKELVNVYMNENKDANYVFKDINNLLYLSVNIENNKISTLSFNGPCVDMDETPKHEILPIILSDSHPFNSVTVTFI